MQRTIIILALIAGLTGPACAQVGYANLLALDDEALVGAYLAAVFRDAGDDEPFARKMAYKDRNLPMQAHKPSSPAKVRAIRAREAQQRKFRAAGGFTAGGRADFRPERGGRLGAARFQRHQQGCVLFGEGIKLAGPAGRLPPAGLMEHKQ